MPRCKCTLCQDIFHGAALLHSGKAALQAKVSNGGGRMEASAAEATKHWRLTAVTCVESSYTVSTCPRKPVRKESKTATCGHTCRHVPIVTTRSPQNSRLALLAALALALGTLWPSARRRLGCGGSARRLVIDLNPRLVQRCVHFAHTLQYLICRCQLATLCRTPLQSTAERRSTPRNVVQRYSTIT